LRVGAPNTENVKAGSATSEPLVEMSQANMWAVNLNEIYFNDKKIVKGDNLKYIRITPTDNAITMPFDAYEAAC